jgi:hypothetical protein
VIWLDVVGAASGVVVTVALLALLDPGLVRRWFARIGGQGPRGR